MLYTYVGQDPTLYPQRIYGQTSESAGIDLKADLDRDDPATGEPRGIKAFCDSNLENELEMHDGVLFVPPQWRVLIPTGLKIGITEGWTAFVFARSGTSLKKGLVLANSVGVIDSDYAGEVMVAVTNISSCNVGIKHGDRIAQLVVLKNAPAFFSMVDPKTFEDFHAEKMSTRGEGGFGSTGGR